MLSFDISFGNPTFWDYCSPLGDTFNITLRMYLLEIPTFKSASIGFSELFLQMLIAVTCF